MGKKNLMTKEEVLKKIGARDFRSITSDQIIEFVSCMPEMDKDVARACIAQFPIFKDQATDMIMCMTGLCEEMMDKSSKTRNKAIESYQVVLVELQKMLNKKFLSKKRKDEIIDKMIYVSEKIAEEAEKQDRSFKDLIHGVGAAVGGVLALGATILGVRFRKK